MVPPRDQAQAPQQSPSKMLGSALALASFLPEGEGWGFIFLFIPGAEGSEGGLSPEGGHLLLSAIPVGLEARHSLEVESRRSRASAFCPPASACLVSCPQVDDRQKDRRRFRAGVCIASASESLSCRGSHISGLNLDPGGIPASAPGSATWGPPEPK